MGRHSTNVPAILSAAVMACLTAVLPNGPAYAQSSVSQAIIGEQNQKTPEVSTEDVRRILADGSGIVIDARKRSEYVAGHIAGAKSAMLEASSTPAAFVAAVERLVGSDKSRQLVLYCNGPNCKASIQLGEMLVSSGYANVRRYQLGLPMWRTLSGPVEIELEGILRVYTIDRNGGISGCKVGDGLFETQLAGVSQRASRQAVNRWTGQGAHAGQRLQYAHHLVRKPCGTGAHAR